MKTNIAICDRPSAASFWVLGDQLRYFGGIEGRGLHVFEVLIPPGSSTPPHTHESLEIFHVIEGEVTFGIFEVGEPRFVKGLPGTVVTVPSNCGHNYVNASQENARVLVIAEEQMHRFFNSVASPDPLKGPPSPADLERVGAACSRAGIHFLQLAR
ncbi:MAG: cupin domain-containing protein [Opitutaceae bacterium]|nr:cupin domain-containing protein [Opitutaceae bacterium]